MNHKSPTGCRPGQLFGLWAIEPGALAELVAAAQAYELADLARMNAEAVAREVMIGADDKSPPAKPYAVDDGVAVIEMSGPTTKYPTSFSKVLGGTSTVMTERAIRQAVADPDVRSVVMHFDDVPGGTVAGAFELYDAIRKADAAKPVYGHASDQCTSAGQLFASACRRVTANRTAAMGSVGVRAELVDSSERAKRDGVKVIPVASGKFKAAGAPGTEITPDQVAEFQKRIDAMNDQFVAAVAEGRGIDPKAVRDMEARVYIGAQAEGQKLIDAVGSFDDAVAYARSHHQQTLPPTADRGAAGPGHAHAAPSDRSSDMELLAKMREVLGAPEMTEEQAVDRVRAMQTAAAAAAAAPKPVDASLLAERGELACERVDALLEGAKVLPPQADRLKKLFMGEDGRKPNAALLGDGQAYKAVLAAVAAGDRAETDKAADRLKERKELRAEDRETPGAAGTPGHGDDDVEKHMKAGRDQAAAYQKSLGPTK